MSQTLPKDHPTAVAFLDESGAIANDRFFAVGCLKLVESAPLLRQVQRLRDRAHWYNEIHYVDLTMAALPLYRQVVDLLAASDAQFSCFVCDRARADPVQRFGGQFEAYEALAAQLLVGSIKPRELVTVLADNYSSPIGTSFEESLRARVNSRLKRLAITNVVRLDSRAAEPLQLVDLLVSAVTFRIPAECRSGRHAEPEGQTGRVREAGLRRVILALGPRCRVHERQALPGRTSAWADGRLIPVRPSSRMEAVRVWASGLQPARLCFRADQRSETMTSTEYWSAR